MHLRAVAVCCADNLLQSSKFKTTCAYSSVSLASDSRAATRSRLSHAAFGVAALGSTSSSGACLAGEDPNVKTCGGAWMAARRKLSCPRLFPKIPPAKKQDEQKRAGQTGQKGLEIL